jgi:tRNA A-37 threonylcarbamoyl transferase component Bud32
MVKHKIINYDLHRANIMYSSSESKWYFIDFGGVLYRDSVTGDYATRAAMLDGFENTGTMQSFFPNASAKDLEYEHEIQQKIMSL